MNWYKIAKKPTIFYSGYDQIRHLHEDVLNIYSENPPTLTHIYGEAEPEKIKYYAEVWVTGPDWEIYYYIVEQQWPYGGGIHLLLYNTETTSFPKLDMVFEEICFNRREIFERLQKIREEKRTIAEQEGRKPNWDQIEDKINNEKYSTKKIGDPINEKGKILSKFIITAIDKRGVGTKGKDDEEEIIELPVYEAEHEFFGKLWFSSFATVNINNYVFEKKAIRKKWYKLASIESFYIASDLPPDFVLEHGFQPQYNPEDWGMGSHVMPPAIFLANEEGVQKYHHRFEGSQKKSRPYLYKVSGLDESNFFPDIPSLVDLGAYFEDYPMNSADMYESDSRTKSILAPFMVDIVSKEDLDDSYIINLDDVLEYAKDDFWRAIFELTGTVAYTKSIPPEKIEFLTEI